MVQVFHIINLEILKICIFMAKGYAMIEVMFWKKYLKVSVSKLGIFLCMPNSQINLFFPNWPPKELVAMLYLKFKPVMDG